MFLRAVIPTRFLIGPPGLVVTGARNWTVLGVGVFLLGDYWGPRHTLEPPISQGPHLITVMSDTDATLHYSWPGTRPKPNCIISIWRKKERRKEKLWFTNYQGDPFKTNFPSEGLRLPQSDISMILGFVCFISILKTTKRSANRAWLTNCLGEENGPFRAMTADLWESSERFWWNEPPGGRKALN